MKGEMMLPNTKIHTVLPVSGSFQVGVGRLEVGNGEKAPQPYGVFKKMTARSG